MFWPVVFVFSFAFRLVACGEIDFDPYVHEKKLVSCPLVNRVSGQQEFFNMGFVEFNPTAPRTLILVHGWPGLWSTWFRQIEEFQRDFHLIVPDLRGFGLSSITSPGFDIRYSGGFADHISDLECIIKSLEIEKPRICVGHDWGSQICYEGARARPDLINGVIGLTIPYLPATGSFTPARFLHKLSPRLAYQEYFNSRTFDAATELSKDVRRSLRCTLGSKGRWIPDGYLKSSNSFLDAWSDVEVPPIDFMSSRQEDYLVEAYEKSGFANTLGFYMDENRKSNWDLARKQGNYTLPVPVLTLIPNEDTVAKWGDVMKISRTAEYIPLLRVEEIDAAHWLPQDAYTTVNAMMRDWLEQYFAIKEEQSIVWWAETTATTWSDGTTKKPTSTLAPAPRTEMAEEVTRDEL